MYPDPKRVRAHKVSVCLDAYEHNLLRALAEYQGEQLSVLLRDLVVREDLPGLGVKTEEEILDFVRRNSQTLYHPVGTCRMGKDALAVVDSRLRVHGVERLRVVDASIMPEIVSGNTNAPTIMIGEKASDMIFEDAR